MRREITSDGKLIIGLITAICLLINEPETNDTGIVEPSLIGCSDSKRNRRPHFFPNPAQIHPDYSSSFCLKSHMFHYINIFVFFFYINYIRSIWINLIIAAEKIIHCRIEYL